MNYNEEDFVPMHEDIIRQRILHALKVWPKLSPSMLQIAIGTAITPKLWHPILEKLIKEGKISRNEIEGKGVSGRDMVYTVLSLPESNRFTKFGNHD